MSVGVADIVEIVEEQRPSQAGGQGSARDSGGKDTGPAAQGGQLQTMIPPAPVQPPNTAPRFNTITYSPSGHCQVDWGSFGEQE